MSNAMLDDGVGEAAYQPTSKLLRELVLDFLLHSSYINTARAFAKESATRAKLEIGDEADSHTDNAIVRHSDDEDELMVLGDAPEEPLEDATEYIPEAEQRIVRLRRDIRANIVSGEIDEATRLLKQHFPTVLEPPQELPIHAPAPSSFTYARPLSYNLPMPLQARVHYTSQTSTDPIHIALNLRIHAFIETARSLPLPRVVNGRFVGDEKNRSREVELLHRAQRMYAEVEALQDSETKKIYRKELQTVGGLLAYPEPEKSPMSYYFEQSRREAVAEQVNSAILSRLSKPTISNLELVARQTSTVWSVLHDNQHKLPPHGLWPPGVLLPRTNVDAQLSARPRPGSKADKDSDIVPLFELRDLIEG